MKRLLVAAVFSLVWACAHARPDDMSAKAHRQEAAEHQRQAHDVAAKYDPEAERVIAVGRGPFASSTGPDDLRSYNPTAQALEAADKHVRAAHQHLDAARALEQGEVAECKAIPPEARGACPLLTPYVATVEETARGVILRLKENAPAAEVLGRMRCHAAYARARAFAQPSCPLYHRGVDIASKDARAIELSAQDARTAADVRLEARRLFAPP